MRAAPRISDTFTPMIQLANETYFLATAASVLSSLYKYDWNSNLTRVWGADGPINNIYDLSYADGGNLVLSERLGDQVSYASFNLNTLAYESYPELKVRVDRRTTSQFGSLNGHVAFFATSDGENYELFVRNIDQGLDPGAVRPQGATLDA